MNDKIEKNLKYILKIDGMGYQGEGIGKINGFTVFVPGALPGEKVNIKVIKVNKSFAFGKLFHVIEPSSERVNPSCPIYKRCGGCQLQHMSYRAQLNFKKNRVKDCLERIGKFQVAETISENGLKLYDTIGMKNPYRYRNKVQLPVGRFNSKLKIGFYANRSHDIIDMDSCLIQNESADEAVKFIREWIEKYNIPVYDEKAGRGIVRHIMIRKAFTTGEIMVVIVTYGSKLPAKDEFIEILTGNISHIVSIIQNINDKKTNVVLGQKSITLWGKDSISDYIDNFKFNISPLSFFQVNPLQTRVLYHKALEYAGLTGNEIVFDAYCGTGTISLFLSQKAKKVYGVEIIEAAVENARINAAENGIHNVEFITGKSEEIIPRLIEQGTRADVVVVDPPRKGCATALLHSIADMVPRTIVYVSCDPATLARDLAILRDLGYVAEKVQPVDMFPETAHVETIVSLQRKHM
ncbi:23S rRNA (uracil(1939)-C(5))-methyltransferase RlmD [Clostridium sp. WLY-B-L2]|jgi:23S rRNA (uracil1939-C5)-methyltransferase|uniref:23S rRNA (Uracil(1939)-C(5))-methyltransferase RlmD n=1 Tax=Clostridium aromativorans TaxID=2836848 RepID=A0ABS8N966_9CLOT|nr:23S rRNA (uracil(1939)-C(5))-methyltransferase RlmD [Clostridium aromativorans]MCC9296357.1 23S rRNA (uracil(1939)-C(5))-methyltransferase RlmD [Clostridium aromativorans]